MESADTEDRKKSGELFKFKQQLVEKEGKAARSVANWTLPANEKRREKGRGNKNGGRRERRQSRRRPASADQTRNSSRKNHPCSRPDFTRRAEEKMEQVEKGEETRESWSAAGEEEAGLALNEVVCVAAAEEYTDSQRRRAGLPNKKGDQQARYWSYLFDNLHRAVDEIYCTCEADESIVECQEVLMMLDVCRSDFEALIARIELQSDFENTSKENRPSSLAWGVRKSISPNKLYSVQSRFLVPPSSAHFRKEADDCAALSECSSVRSLDFSSAEQHKERESSKVEPSDSSKESSTSNKTGGSWADRVKGVSSQQPVSIASSASSSSIAPQLSTEQEKVSPTTAASLGDSDEGGEVPKTLADSGDWEKVMRHHPRHGNHVERGDTIQLSPVPVRRNKDSHKSQVESSSCSLCEEDVGDQSSSGNNQQDTKKLNQEESWKVVVQEQEVREKQLELVAWADHSDSPPSLGLPEGRSPGGRGVQIHQKLSSPMRKRAGEDFIKELEEKQAKAQELRDRLQEEKAQRSRTVFEKVKVVNKNRDARTLRRKEVMEGRLERAQQLRVSFLQEVVRKAQEEDTKVNEIAFINCLEAQNKKMEVLERHMGIEARLQDIQEERQRKKEENQAKEEAASERRRSKEAERVAKLQEKRREQEAKHEHLISEREKAREEAARERARERERKLEAHNAAFISSVEELEKKIQLKRDESSRRYGQHLEFRKEKAAVISRHSSTDYAPAVEAYKRKKWCSMCHVKIVSEVYLMSHLRGRKHCEALQAAGLTEQPDPLAVIVHAPDEAEEPSPVMAEVQARLKSGKKRAKKIKQRMVGRIAEFESIYRAPKPSATAGGGSRQHRLVRHMKELSKQVESVKTSWNHSVLSHLERTLGELSRLLALKCLEDQTLFCQLGGIACLSQLLSLYLEPTSPSKSLPDRPFMLAVSIMEAGCRGHVTNCRYLLLTNKMSTLIDLAARNMASHQPPSATKGAMDRSFSSPKTKEHHIPHANVCGPLFTLMAVVLGVVTQSDIDPITDQAIKDCISYLVCTGLLDKVSECFKSITGPFDDMATSLLIIGCLNVLVVSSAALHSGIVDVFTENPPDPTQLICVLLQTELAGILPLLYALLLHDGPPRHSSLPPALPSHLLSIATAGIKAINNMAILALRVVQTCLGAEGISLEFRHVVSYLLWYCSHHEAEQLRYELILTVGYFSVLNPDNQLFLLSGRNRTLLQTLCQLPFNYFTDPELSKLLYPTLMAACYGVVESKEVLEQEVSCSLLCSYLEAQIHLDDKGSLEEKSAKKTTPDWIAQQYRFPKSHWKKALDFFTSKTSISDH